MASHCSRQTDSLSGTLLFWPSKNRMHGLWGKCNVQSIIYSKWNRLRNHNELREQRSILHRSKSKKEHSKTARYIHLYGTTTTIIIIINCTSIGLLDAMSSLSALQDRHDLPCVDSTHWFTYIYITGTDLCICKSIRLNEHMGFSARGACTLRLQRNAIWQTTIGTPASSAHIYAFMPCTLKYRTCFW